MFDAAVNVSVAVAWPELATPTVALNVVASPSLHPSITTGADGDPAKVKSGSTRAISSPAFSGEFISNEYAIGDATAVDGRAMVRVLCVSTGSSTAVDVAIAPALMLPVASVAATVRVARFAACDALLVVTPLGTDTVHGSYAANVAVPAARLSVASAWPELLTVGVNVVEPHPVTVTCADVEMPVMVNVGSTSSMLSVECTSGMFSANVNDTALAASVTGVSMVNTLCTTAGDAGTATAVDRVIAVVLGMFFAPASVTPTLRDVSSALCAVALVVTPVSIATVHRV